MELAFHCMRVLVLPIQFGPNRNDRATSSLVDSLSPFGPRRSESYDCQKRLGPIGADGDGLMGTADGDRKL